MKSYDLDIYNVCDNEMYGTFDTTSEIHRDLEMYGTFDDRSTEEIHRDLEMIIEQRRQEEKKFEEQRKIYIKEIEERRKIIELEQIEIARQKEIKRADKLKKMKEQIIQCNNYNNENDTFTDPITFEEISIEDGIVLDNQIYSIASMLIWSKEHSIVPHSRRKLNELEREIIGCELRPEDDPDSYQGPYYSDSDYESEYDSDYDFNPSHRRIHGVERDMSWGEFVAFMQNLQSFFSNNIIDSIADERFVVSNHQIVMTIRRYYQDEAGVPQTIFDIQIKAYGKDLHHRANEAGTDSIFLHRVKRLILSRGLARNI